MVLIDVFAPSVDKTYQFNLNENVKISVVTAEIAEMIGRREHMELNGRIEDMNLYDQQKGSMLAGEHTLSEYGIHSGYTLILL